MQPEGLTIDSYSKLTDKVYRMFMDTYKFKKNQYSWYLKADIDTFIFVDNLKKFLKTKKSSHPVSYGYEFTLFCTEP